MVTTNQKLISWDNFRLANAKVHVWHASLDQPEGVVQALEVLLSEEEKQRAEQFRFPQHRQAFVVRRGILRILLSQYTGIAPMQIEFKYTLTGKPHLANQEDF